MLGVLEHPYKTGDWLFVVTANFVTCMSN